MTRPSRQLHAELIEPLFTLLVIALTRLWMQNDQFSLENSAETMKEYKT